ncbi:MAG: hypothetical protein WBO58_14165, partial [Gammaproteobacteria bacterium]
LPGNVGAITVSACVLFLLQKLCRRYGSKIAAQDVDGGGEQVITQARPETDTRFENQIDRH